MNFWGYSIDTPLEWVAVAVLLGIVLALYFSLVWFVQKFTTGIVGGLIMMALGMGLVMMPTYTLITEAMPMAQMLVYVAAIFAGCVTILIGVFSLRDFRDF